LGEDDLVGTEEGGVHSADDIAEEDEGRVGKSWYRREGAAVLEKQDLLPKSWADLGVSAVRIMSMLRVMRV
jgi:hypothetical protein